MRAISSFALALLLSWSGAVFAGAFDCDRALLEALDRRDCPYLTSQCSTNTIGILEFAIDRIPGFDVSRAKIIYFHSPGEMMPVFQARAAAGWNYHVVVEYGGLIFDQDRRDRGGLVTVPEYVEGMFRVSLGANLGTKAIVLPALDYLMELGYLDSRGRLVTPENYFENLEEVAKRYPVIRVSDLLDEGLPETDSPYAANSAIPREPRLGISDNMIYWRDGGEIVALEPSTADIRVILPKFKKPSNGQLERFRETVDRRSRESEEIAHIWRWFLRVEENRAKSNWFRFTRPW